jgi:predicted O-methyltransferase YrrM
MTEQDYPNWFIKGGASTNFSKHLLRYKDQKVDFLQLGAYTGDASRWLLENVLTHPEATLTDVDTWEGSDEPEHKTMEWKNVEDTYDEKNAKWLDSKNIVKKKMTTNRFFLGNDRQFDFVYVDADHTAFSTLVDGLNAFKVLKNGGILAFDDYQWGQVLEPKLRPQPAIDAFLVCYKNKATVLEHGLQVWLQKIF